MTVQKGNYKRINLKRKVFSKGRQNIKRYKRTPKYIRDNPENKIAREKDVYNFTDSEEDDNDLGMGLDISDLPILDDNHEEKQRQLMALTQDTVRPLFNDETYDESKLVEGLTELKISSFRDNQKETIKRILYGRSTLFISPTGSGKSLCYLLPALLYWRYRKYMTIVVSPLISLMEDQMNNFPASLKAVTLHSGHNMMQRRRSIEQLVNHEAQVAFISPESIVSGLLTVEDLKNLPPVGFVCIDEAHCLSEWSHNFRPAYMQFFKILNEKMNIKTFLGLTATATKATSFAIARSLVINPETDVIGSTSIPDNLILSVSFETNKEKALIDLLRSATFRILPSIIVYCNRREETERIASNIRTAMQNYVSLIEVPEKKKRSSSNNEETNLNDSNSSSSSEKAHMKLSWKAEAYHAGLSTDTRKRIQRQFIKGEMRVVVATIAFGMGINKSNVRAIIHYDLPGSFESYVQEIGRAGRDGKPAQCHMFLRSDKSDLYYQQRNIYASVTERKNLEKFTEFIFKPNCKCARIHLFEGNNEKLTQRNQTDHHEIKSVHKTKFTDTEVRVATSDEEDDDLEDILGAEANKSDNKENRSVKFVHKSIVKKHRICTGHEKSFSVDDAVAEINLRPESIITLMCQLEKEYPQLQIKQYTPCKGICTLLCYNGPSQMEALAKKYEPVNLALQQHRLAELRSTGSRGETPSKFSFNYINIAALAAKPSADVARTLKKSEWDFDDKTGRFKRSQIRVNFEGNSFHMHVVGDLEDEELKEITEYLVDFTQLYEKLEREKLVDVFNTFKKHCIEVSQMENKTLRLKASSDIKASLKDYFDSTTEHRVTIKNNEPSHEATYDQEHDVEVMKRLKIKEIEIRKDAKAFISAHGKKKEFTPRVVARIFQGISTPNYPSEIWGMNKKWWRLHPDVDFLFLTRIIHESIL